MFSIIAELNERGFERGFLRAKLMSNKFDLVTLNHKISRSFFSK